MISWKYFAGVFVSTLCVFLFSSVCVYAKGDVSVYSLDDCIRIGLARSAEVVSARLDRDIAGTRRTMARAGLLPHVLVSAAYNRLDELQTIDLGDEESELGALNNYSATIGITQSLYSGGKSMSAIKMATFLKDHAAETLAESEGRIVCDVKIAFYRLLLANAAVKVREVSCTHLQTLVRQIREKFDHGAVSEFDLLTAEVKLANEKPLLIQARNENVLAKERLRRLLRLDNSFVIDGSLSLEDVAIDLPSLQRKALKQRALIRALEADVQMADEGVKIARTDSRPSLNAQLNYNGANSYKFVSYEQDKLEWHWSAGLVLEWNLWDGGLSKAVVSEKLLEAEKMRTALDDAIRTVRFDIKECYLSIKHARELAISGEKSVQLAERAMKITETRCDAGLATHVEFSDANMALNVAQLMRLSAVCDHMISAACLEFVSGSGRRVEENGDKSKNYFDCLEGGVTIDE